MVAIWSFISLVIWIFILFALLYLSTRSTRYTTFHKQHAVWITRLKTVALWIGFDEKNPNNSDILAEVAGEIADYFLDVNWTPSDILAGLILVKRKQKMRFEEKLERRRVELDLNQSNDQSVSLDKSTDILLPPSLFFGENSFNSTKFIVTPPDLVITTDSLKRKKSRLDLLRTKSLMTTTPPQSPTKLKKSDIPDILYFAKYMSMMYYRGAVQETISKDPESVLHYSESNDVYKSPYLIILDHEWKSVVITIRGSYSVADLLVDMKVDMVEFNIPELDSAPTQYVHSGFLVVANNILEDIERENILGGLRDNSLYKDYRVVVTGHSLGGAVGSLLTYFLRSRGFKDARCYSYNCPGMVLTWEAAEYFDGLF